MRLMMTFRALRDSSKQRLGIIPYFFTFANACLGLLAVIKALDGEFVTSAYCILFAGVMDMFDGKIARAFGTTSSLGMELDSLCDAISFCLAPTIVLYSWSLYSAGSFGIAILSTYLCSGLYRLAKFNTTHDGQTIFFSGLPTPVSALLLASCVAYFPWLTTVSPLDASGWMMLLVVCMSFLMISPINFLTFKQLRLTKFLKVMAFFCANIIFFCSFVLHYPIPLILFASYILANLLFLSHTRKTHNF